MLIFERSRPGRRAQAQSPRQAEAVEIAADWLRQDGPVLPEVSEMDAVRHYTRLSQLIELATPPLTMPWPVGVFGRSRATSGD